LEGVIAIVSLAAGDSKTVGRVARCVVLQRARNGPKPCAFGDAHHREPMRWLAARGQAYVPEASQFCLRALEGDDVREAA
jgi:hypothetical protein